MAHTKFHKLYESFRDFGEKEALQEVSEETVDLVLDRLRTTDAGKLQLQFDHIFGPEDVRIAFPMVTEKKTKANEMMRQLVQDHGWKTKFTQKEVEQKQKQGDGSIRTIKRILVDPIMTKKVIRVIPKGPKAGQKIEREEKTTLARVIKKTLDPEWFEFWQENQTFFLEYENAMEFLVTPVMNEFELGETDKYVIITRAPIDVLRMSDHDGWTSCHSSPDKSEGEYYHCAVSEAIGEGAIAYIVYADDYEKIKDRLQDAEIFEDYDRNMDGISPISRIRIRHLFDKGEKKSYAIPGMRKYGQNVIGFMNILHDWFKKKQKQRLSTIAGDLEERPRDFIYTGGTYTDNSLATLLAQLTGNSSLRSYSIRHEDYFGTEVGEAELRSLGFGGGPSEEEVYEQLESDLDFIQYEGGNASVSYYINEESFNHDDGDFAYGWEASLRIENEAFDAVSSLPWRQHLEAAKAVEAGWDNFVSEEGASLEREVSGFGDVDFSDEEITIRFESAYSNHAGVNDEHTDFNDICNAAEELDDEDTIQLVTTYILEALMEAGYVESEQYNSAKAYKEELFEFADELKYFDIDLEERDEIGFTVKVFNIFHIGPATKWAEPFVELGLEEEDVLRGIHKYIAHNPMVTIDGRRMLSRDLVQKYFEEALADEMSQVQLPLTKIEKGQAQMFGDNKSAMRKIVSQRLFSNMRTEFRFRSEPEVQAGNITFSPNLIFGMESAIEDKESKELFKVMLKYLDRNPTIFSKVAVRFYRSMIKGWWRQYKLNLKTRTASAKRRSGPPMPPERRIKPHDIMQENETSARLYQIEMQIVIDRQRSGGIDAAMNRIRSIEGVTVISHQEPEMRAAQEYLRAKIKFHPLKDSMTPQTYVRTILVPSINKSSTVPGVRIVEVIPRTLKRLQ